MAPTLEEPCPDPACNEVKDRLSAAFNRQTKSNKNKNKDSRGDSNGNVESSTISASSQEESATTGALHSSTAVMDDPPDIADIGQASWTLIHTTAAYYPADPSETQQAQARNFIHALAHLYPCSFCRRDFADYVKDHPVEVKNRQLFTQWTCDAHNDVNQKLGKKVFDCTLFMQRWRGSQY